MAIIRYSETEGWHDARITARAPLTIDPASSVLHYAQEIFEGMKAYRLADGGTALFRPEANARRFQDSARRLAMPELPEDLFLESVERLVRTDANWIPESDGGALYLRPFMFASEVFLGVKPSAEYLYMVLASSVGAYFKGGAPTVSIWVSQQYTRAAQGWHRRGQVRRQLRRQPARAVRGDPQRLRPGRLPRCGRAALGLRNSAA